MALSKLETPAIINECETKKFQREFELPEIKRLFKYERNQFDYNPLLVEWVNDVFKVSAMSAENYAKIRGCTIFPAYCHPSCEDIKRYEVVVKVHLLFFVLDDHTECSWGDVARGSQASKLIWGQLENGIKAIQDNNLSLSTNGWKGYVKEMFIILQQMSSTYNEVQKKRFFEIWYKCIEKTKEECDKIETKYQFKDIDEILEIRMHSVAGVPIFQMIEYANNIDVTEKEWHSMQEFIDNAMISIIICNDIYSFEKEYNEQSRQLNRMYNVVAFTALSKQVPIELAMIEMAQLCFNYEQKTLDLMNRLKSDGMSENMLNLLDGIGYIVGGNHEVSMVLDRYNKKYNK